LTYTPRGGVLPIRPRKRGDTALAAGGLPDARRADVAAATSRSRAFWKAQNGDGAGDAAVKDDDDDYNTFFKNK